MENRKGEFSNYQNTNNMNNYRQSNYNVNYNTNYNHNTNNTSNFNNYNNQNNNNRINKNINYNQGSNYNNINQNVNHNVNFNTTNNSQGNNYNSSINQNINHNANINVANNNRINQNINYNQGNNYNSNVNQNVNRNVNINTINNSQNNNRNINNNYYSNINQNSNLNNNRINNNYGNSYPNNQVNNNYNNQYPSGNVNNNYNNQYQNNTNYTNPYQNNNYNPNYYNQSNQYNGNNYGYNQGYNSFNPNYNNYYGNMPNNGYQQSNYESKLNVVPENDKEKKKSGIKFHLGKRINIKKIIIILLIIVVLLLVVFFAKNLLISYDVKIYLNGASSVEEDEMSCKSDYLGRCTLTLPIAKRDDGEVLGYSTVVDSRTAEYKIGQKIKLDDDMVLFVISKKDNELKIDTSDIDELSVSKDELKCSTYNSENKCSITVPLFNKRGYDIMGYSEKKESQNVTVRSGDKYQGGKTLYPVYKKWATYPAKIVDSVKDSFPLSNAYVDVESSCPNNVVEKYTEYVKKIDKNWPFLFHGQKIVFHGADAFSTFTGFSKNSGVGGVTYNASEMAPLSVKCVNPSDSSFDAFYMVFVHELSHSYDMEYAKYFNKKISEESDIKALYNKYKDYRQNRPLRAYAYEGTGAYSPTIEFFAELMSFYYLNYVDTEYKLVQGKIYYRGNFPDDMKKVAEKYICIGMNKYDKSKCA